MSDRTPTPALGHLAYLAVEAFGPPPGSSGWLDTPHEQLQGRRPWDVAQASRDGYEQVLALLRAESPRPLPDRETLDLADRAAERYRDALRRLAE